MTILDVLQSDGFSLKKVANTKGGEWHGVCPWCGGRDRFIVQPFNDDYRRKGGAIKCRQCMDKWTDGIQYLIDKRGLKYPDAFRYFNGTDPEPRNSTAAIRTDPPEKKWIPETTTYPPEKWSAFFDKFIDTQMLALHKKDDCLTWLQEERGLQPRTLRLFGIGWIDSDIYLNPGALGLTHDSKVRIPAGLIIPWYGSNGHVIRVRVRTATGEPRYWCVSGSCSLESMNLSNQNHDSFVIVESELDALLLWQVAGDLVGIIALGSVDVLPDAATHVRLMKAKRIMVSLDFDAPGAKAWNKWKALYSNSVLLPTVEGKDPTEDYLSGVNIRSWIKAGLQL